MILFLVTIALIVIAAGLITWINRKDSPQCSNQLQSLLVTMTGTFAGICLGVLATDLQSTSAEKEQLRALVKQTQDELIRVAQITQNEARSYLAPDDPSTAQILDANPVLEVITLDLLLQNSVFAKYGTPVAPKLLMGKRNLGAIRNTITSPDKPSNVRIAAMTPYATEMKYLGEVLSLYSKYLLGELSDIALSKKLETLTRG
jgi:hypothetical protein